MTGSLGTRSTQKLAGLAAAAVAVLLTVAVPSAGAVDAAPRSSSTAIADEADRALDALGQWERSGDPTDYVRFIRGRDRTASMTARDLEIDESSLRSAWTNVDVTRQQAVLSALSQLGVPYQSLKSEEGVGFDCSGLTIFAFAEAGVEIPRVSGDQINFAESVEADEATTGDLVYYPGHIGIYLGAETLVHSPNSGNLVEVVHLPKKSVRFGDVTG